MILKHWLLVVIIVRLLAVDAVVEALFLINKIFILVLLNDLTKLSFILKKGIWVGAEEEGPRPSSDRDGRIYLLAVTVPK